MDAASMLQRLVRSGALSTAQARWVELQADYESAPVETILVRHGLVRTEDLGPPPDPSGQGLVAVAAAQRRCDQIMRVIFDLCVRRGIIDEGEYLERLAEAEAAAAAPREK